jgi:hypothetical protein
MKLATSLLVLCLSFVAPLPTFAGQEKTDSPIATPLTEVEQLKLERAALLQQVEGLVREVAQWRQMFANASSRLGEFEVAVQQEQNKAYTDSVVKAIEAARPGFTFDPKSGSFTPKAGTPKQE